MSKTLKNYKPSFFSSVTSQIPFINSTDGNRIQMAASMIRQHQDLIEPEPPYITTFYSALRFNSLFVQRAKTRGKIVDKTNRYILIEYDENSLDKLDNANFELYKYDLLIKPNLPTFKMTHKQIGDAVNENEVLIWHKSYNPKLNQIMFGKNIRVMFSSYNGFTHDDSIVLSKSGQNKFASYFYDTIEIIIPDENFFFEFKTDINFGKLKQGVIATISYISSTLKSVITPAVMEEIKNPYENFTISDIMVFSTNLNKILESKIQSDKFKEFVKKFDVNKIFQNNPIVKKMAAYNINNDMLVYILLLGYFIHTPMVGDKFANPWGNKGIVSKIDDEIFLIDSNSNSKINIDMVLTPVGVHARMNPSQIFYMSFADFLKYKVPEILSSMNYEDGLKFILKLYEHIDKNAHDIIVNLLKSLPDEEREEFIKQSIDDARKNGLIMTLTQFTYNIPYKIKAILDSFNYPTTAKNQYGDDIGFGTIYTMKLEHLVIKKITQRSMYNYNRKTFQPDEYAQRIGEMEVWTLVAYDVLNLLKETLTVKSDDIDNKLKVVKDILLTGKAALPQDVGSKTFEVFDAYLNGIGFEFKKRK